MQSFGQSKVTIPNPTPVGHDNTYQNTTRLSHIDKPGLPHEDGGIHDRGANVDDVLDHIQLALKGAQSYWMPVSVLDPMLVYFPYAWYLDKATRIFNVTTGAEYIIDFYDNKIGSNVVKLKGGDGVVPPKKGDIFAFDETTGKNLMFQHAYPNSDDVNRYVTPEEIQKNMTDGFTDTIAYKIKRHEPAAIKGVTQFSPRLMEEQTDLESGEIKSVFMEHFESEFNFQCWTKTAERTARLARWFRTFMRMYKSAFQLNGVQQITFMRQSEEYNVTRWRNDIVGTTLIYSVRTQELFEQSNVQMKDFATSIAVSETGERIGVKMDIENE